ncbi:15722_t:CDS:2 [Funneliformis geosporum]|uniref:15722_t:CDS:1 n=1 Tax=Funneliformis geosporum TaxID=1117311 RepID=A0A9W4WLJ8_9GLOM|nr:15722_t:CDS:2 [Funneliformis geosporum]
MTSMIFKTGGDSVLKKKLKRIKPSNCRKDGTFRKMNQEIMSNGLILYFLTDDLDNQPICKFLANQKENSYDHFGT